MERFRVRVQAPSVVPRLTKMAAASLLLKLIASGVATSRPELGRRTGLARTTIDSTVTGLLDAGALGISGLRDPDGRGRPAEVLTLSPDLGVVLVADCGATFTRLAVFDLGQNCLAEHKMPLHLASGPEQVLAELAGVFERLLAESGLQDAPRHGVIGLPGPVDYRAGTLVRPPLLPMWDGYPVAADFERLLGAPCALENDVNLHALGEARALEHQRGPLLFIKVGTGVGAGIVDSEGALFRGLDGGAGDIGHVRVPGSTALCVCGAEGCLEASASVPATGRALGLREDPGASLLDQVTALIRQGDREAISEVRRTAMEIGEAVVSMVHVLNPEHVVVGGRLALASDDLLAGVRSVVYQRALPLATRNLTITRPSLGMASGLAGGLAMGLESALEPEALSAALGNTSAPVAAAPAAAT